MCTSSFQVVFVAGVVAAAVVTPGMAADPVCLSYIGRYDCHCAVGRDHLVGVEQVRDHYALVSSYEGLVVIDLDDLTPGGTQTYIDQLPGINVHSTVTSDDGYVFAGLQMQGGFAVVHLAPDQTLTLLGTVSEPGVYFGRMTLVGDRLYVPAHAYGIRIYDVAEPASPVLVGSLQEGFVDAFAIAVAGQTAYVADGAGGLKIVDLSDETAPTIVAGETLETSVGTAEDVLVIGQHVYMAAGGAGVAGYEAGDVASRVVYDIPICAKQLAQVGDYLAVVDLGGLRIFGREPDGSLTASASESGFRRYRGPDDLSIRLWQGVTSWGDQRIVTADWDSVDVYELVDPAVAAQPDLTASSQRIRLDAVGGSTIVRLENQGSADLHVTDVANTVPTFVVSPQSAVLAPGETLDLSITYLGGQPGGTVVLVHSDDPDESPLPIEVFGATQYLDPGETAAPFTLESWTFDHATREFSHGTFNLSDQSERIVFFHVFGTWCPACLPAAADAQNTIVKEFADDPRVVTAVMSQNEPRGALETFWRNVYLRGPMLFDPTGVIARDTYGQPPTGLPFSRAFIIGRDQVIVLPFFGHKPQLVIDTIHDLLDEFPPFDLDGDGMVGVPDLLVLLGSWGPCGDCAYCPSDLDGDCTIGVSDLLALLAHWGQT